MCAAIWWPELAQSVVEAGAVPLLLLCLQEPEMALKRISASALSDIAKHTPELAHTVVDSGAIAHLAQMILNPDAKLKLFLDTNSSEDLQVKCKKALKNVLQKCTHLPALEPLLYEAPSNVLKHVVCQFSKTMEETCGVA
ncbi:Sperm-associated antigen 6 [Merluccius polli]|uniref:Sperm-associated antigen 6 n=1 Tax=Merluccius polli TaxID=89951 RepID=A0AA47MIM9_MERPO|nr:Sperm-associated antigen 6 [Merluccius polli]